MVTSQQILSAKKCGDIFSSDCKQDVIAEYREIARVYHPDISTDPKANEVMAKVNQLYEEALRLIDVGVMGHCVHGASGLCLKSGVQCYQNGLKTHHPNMSLENFKRIVDECKGKTFQLALGGRGDVDQHENFAEILQYCRENNIVPNFTSSGLGFTNEIVSLCKEYCGAVAISWYRQSHTIRAIQMLLDVGIKTNIHYVLGQNSIDALSCTWKTNGLIKEWYFEV